MTENDGKCCTCAKSNDSSHIHVRQVDSDLVSYWDKLVFCVSPDLVHENTLSMCLGCISQLRICYEFKSTALRVQEMLKKGVKIDESPGIKKENHSDDNSETSSTVENVECEIKKRKSISKGMQYKNLVLPCDYCGNIFDKQWKLKKHIAQVHTASRKYACSNCPKVFKQLNHLQSHVTSHSTEKKFSCSICEKKFQLYSSQQRHLRAHEKAPGFKTKKTPFLCSICGKNFPYSNGVQRHMRTHLGIKNHECQWCGRKFMQSTHLRVHVRTHTGEKPFICDTCGHKFTLKACLLRHIRGRHHNCKQRSVIDDKKDPLFIEGTLQ